MYSVFEMSSKSPDKRKCTLFDKWEDAADFLLQEWECLVNQKEGNIADMYHEYGDSASLTDYRMYTWEWYLTEADFNGGLK